MSTKVKDLMTRHVRTCRPDDPLSEAARQMWEGDCGFVPVTDSSGRLRGVVTDRDACMAAYTQGRALHDIRVSNAMRSDVRTCTAEDDVSKVQATMAEHQVRRVPVVDASGMVVGVVSINDLALRAQHDTGHGTKAQVADTLGTICRHHVPAEL